MYWCRECGQETEPIIKKHNALHGEIDTRQYDEYYTYHCPICGKEVEEADRCPISGEYKDKNAEYAMSVVIDLEDRLSTVISEMQEMYKTSYKNIMELIEWEVEQWA